MMYVNKIKIRISNKDSMVKIPLTLDFNHAGQDEVVNDVFIKKEVERSINKIVDYEKVRLTPIKSSGGKIEDLVIKLHFLDKNGNIIIDSKYSDIGFTNNDIRFRKNRFLNSFLRLSFFDSDVTTNQNLVTSMTIFPKITKDTITDLTVNGEPAPMGGLPLPANVFPVKFKMSNPITKPDGFAEGYYLYHYKVDIPKVLYVRAEFNNAKTGKSTRLISVNAKLNIDSLMDKLHVKYLLIKEEDGYYYKLDKEYNNATNIIENETQIILNLYEIQVI